jgi:26S proteasome regulatory subunit N5
LIFKFFQNVRVIAAYYSGITLKRLGQLLDLSVDEAEKFVSDSVSSKTIFAKIDRPKGICSFQKQKDANETLNEWSGALSQVLEIVDKTSHLIQRENMAHKIYKDS